MPTSGSGLTCTLERMADQRFRDPDPIEEILRIAMQNQAGADFTLRQRLLSSAAELGIPEQAVLEAEQQWLNQRKKEQEESEYRAHTLRNLFTHFGVYLVINVAIILINMLTSHGHFTWAVWPILGWGMAFGIHLVVTVAQLKSPGGDDYDNWRKERLKAQKKLSGIQAEIEQHSQQPQV